MGWYILKLVLLLPLLGAMIWGSLKLSKHLQTKMQGASGERAVRLVESSMLAPGIRLAVVEFRGKEILLGSSRHGLTRLAEADVKPGEAQ